MERTLHLEIGLLIRILNHKVTGDLLTLLDAKLVGFIALPNINNGFRRYEKFKGRTVKPSFSRPFDERKSLTLLLLLL